MVSELECLPKQVDKFLKEEEQKAEKNFLLDGNTDYKKILRESIKKHKHFAYINNAGKRFFSRYFIIIYLKLESENKKLFLGIKASKKVFNKAVTRNKIKRRIRHLTKILMDDAQSIKEKPYELHLVFIPKKNFEKINFRHLKNVLLHYLAQSIRSTPINKNYL